MHFHCLSQSQACDGHIIAPRQYDTQRRVHCEASNVVGVSLEGGNLFVSVVIEDAQLEVIRASNEPVFSRNEANASNGDCCDLKRLDSRACFVVVNDHRSVVESSNEPWFRRVEVDRFGHGQTFGTIFAVIGLVSTRISPGLFCLH